MRNQLAAMHDKLVNTKFIEKNNNNIIETQVRKIYQWKKWKKIIDIIYYKYITKYNYLL